MIVNLPIQSTNQAVKRTLSLLTIEQKSVRNYPLAVDKAQRVSTKQLAVLVDKIAQKGNNEYSDCFKECLDESENLYSSNRVKWGPYRITVSINYIL